MIRKLGMFDRDGIRDHLLRLDPETRWTRFAGATSDDFITGYARRIIRMDSAVFGVFADGRLRGIAELHGWGPEAEAALSLERGWQSHGIGDELFVHLLWAAKVRGIRALKMYCLQSNARMRQLAVKHNATLIARAGDVIASIHPEWPLPPLPPVMGPPPPLNWAGAGSVTAQQT